MLLRYENHNWVRSTSVYRSPNFKFPSGHLKHRFMIYDFPQFPPDKCRDSLLKSHFHRFLLRHLKAIIYYNLNPLNAQLNPICHLLALLGAHHILHVSRIMFDSWRPAVRISGRMCYNKNYQQMRLFVLCLYFLFLVFSLHVSGLHGPIIRVFQAVVFMLPFGSCSALLIVCVRQRTGLWFVHRSHHHKPVR